MASCRVTGDSRAVQGALQPVNRLPATVAAILYLFLLRHLKKTFIEIILLILVSNQDAFFLIRLDERFSNDTVKENAVNVGIRSYSWVLFGFMHIKKSYR